MDEIFPVRFVSITNERLLLGILRQEAADSGRGQIKGFAGIGVKLHLNGLLSPAIDIDGSYAVDVFQIGPYLFLHQVTDPVRTARSTHLKRHEAAGKHRDIDLLHLYRETFGKRGGGLVDLLLQLQSGYLEVDVRLEIDLDGRLAAVDLGFDLLYSAYGSDSSFEGDHNLRLHIRRIHILRRGDLHEQHRKLRIRQQLDR